MARVFGKRKSNSERPASGAAQRKNVPAGNNGRPSKGRKPIKTASGEGSKIVFTRENINSHLVSYNENPGNYKLMGMLTYLFKEFDDTPSELLSKLKIITAYKKTKIAGEHIPELILKHLFAVLNMKEPFTRNLFNLLRNNTFLSAMVAELYFATPMESEELVKENLDEIFKELMSILEDKAALSFDSYLEEIRELEECSDLESKVKEMYGEDDPADICGEVEAIGSEKHLHEADSEVADEPSSFSLVSLDDEEQIARLDNELGKQLRANLHNPNDDVYALQLLDCVEKLLTANFIFDLSFFHNLFYLYQFLPLSAQARVLIRIFMEKFNEKSTIFRMYQNSALVIPSLYGLFSVFRSYCGEDFNELLFVKIAIDSGHGLEIVNKVNPQGFYSFYEKSLGKDYETFLVALIRNERSLEALRGLLPDSNDVVKACIEERIESISWRAENPRKKQTKKPENSGKVPAVVKDDDEQSEEDDEVTAEKEVEVTVSRENETPSSKKRTFADKIGAKIANERDELKKKYRWKNFKDKKKADRKAKLDGPVEDAPKITKRHLHENSKPGKKVRKSQQPNRKRV